MTNSNIKNCTTYELECVINSFTWYNNNLLQVVKRELDRRHRLKLIKRQRDDTRRKTK